MKTGLLIVERAGCCQDRAVYGKDGGDLLTDDGPRLCYELPRTLNDSLVLYILEHESEQRAKGKALSSPVSRLVRQEEAL